MNIRSRKVAQQIKEILPEVIRKSLKDPRIDSMVSITDVEVTNDLSYATIYISKLASDQERQELLDIMEKAAGFMRTELSQKLKLRSVPELRFKLDDSLIYGEKIERILQDLKKDEHENE